MAQKKSIEILKAVGREKAIDQSQFFDKVRPVIESFVRKHSKMTINIAGQSAVGKSTISERLAGLFSNSTVLNMDNYLLGWDVGVLNHDSGIPDKPFFAGLNPGVYDLDKLEDDLERLHDGEEIEQPFFDEITKRRGGFKNFSPKPILVIDGIYALDDRFRDFADLSLLVEASLHDRLIRKIFRNSTQHLEAVNSIIATYLTRDEPTYKYHVGRLTEAADWIVANPVQPTIELAKFEPSRPAPKTDQRFIAIPKAENGSLRKGEEVAIILTGRDIFIQYSYGGNVLLSAPIDEATLGLLGQYYELQKGIR